MCRWWITLVLTVALVATAAAQSPQATETVQAQNLVEQVQRQLTELGKQKQALTVRYDGEVKTVARLKEQKKTWSRERELKEKLAAAEQTSRELQAIDRKYREAETTLKSAQTLLVKKIDNELAANPAPDRARFLARLRIQLAPPAKAKRIAIPNLEVDPSADPEDLDAQAAELLRIEAQLEQQAKSLDAQGQKLERLAMRKEAHIRTNTLDRREDNTPTRSTPGERGGRTVSTGAEDAAEPQAPPPTTGGGDTGGNAPPPAASDDVETTASVVLAEVVDPSTIDSLATAHRSGDPAKRAKAAMKTRDAVKAKIDLIKQKRAAIQARAKLLRK